MNIRHVVKLALEERAALGELLRGGRLSVRKLKRAQILLAADEGATDEQISETICVGTSTVGRTRKKYAEQGVMAALSEKARPGADRKLSVSEEALLVAVACSDPPTGRARWTLELLADQMVRLTQHDGVSTETVRRRLHDKDIKPWQHKMWCIAKIDGEFVARMEDVLSLYTSPADPARPVVCFDEKSIQLLGDSRPPLPPIPSVPARIDYEYSRQGTANAFVLTDAHKSFRQVQVTQRRTAVDFAYCMRDLVEVHYPQADKIRVVLDNLSTHTLGALYEAFPAAEARRLVQRLEFHYTPKHASWLNMVEIEIGILARQCLDRRIGDFATLEREVAAWCQQRNASGARIRWLFDIERARTKLGRSYPQPIALQSLSAASQSAA